MALPALGTLTWVRAVDRPDLLAAATRLALEAWAVTDPSVADQVAVAEIDPDLADTAAMTAAYDLPLAVSANCVLVGGRRAGDERVAAAVVRATTRADVNTAVKRLLDVRKASFLPMERAVAESGMEFGGITPLGLPTGYRVLLDAGVTRPEPEAGDVVLLGSGLRRSKVLVPAALLASLPGAEVVDGLAIG